jgi:hypothetical protein
MKYLFIILIAFSFIGCNGEDVTPTSKTIYATFTIPNNTSIYMMTGSCNASGNAMETSGSQDIPLPSGTTITTDPGVISYFPVTVVCGYNLSSQDVNDIVNTEVEISLYVDDELYETRLVTGGGSHNFIVE